MKIQKKVILIIVEGETDATTLKPIFKTFFKDEVIFHIVRNDITSDLTKFDTPIKNQITVLIKKELQISKLTKKDIAQVIYITDMDGAYISKDNIIYKEIPTIEYSLENIYTSNIDSIQKRNILKSRNLNILSTTTKIYNIPFSIYYFSRNLEHSLYNKIESLSKEIKYELSDNFIETENLSIFNNIIENIKLGNDYKNSWESIQILTNSLHRYSNIHILLQDINKYIKLNTTTK